MKKRLCVIGLGYIGLPTSVIFAENGWEVTGVDIDSLAINMLNKGEVHIKEKGLDGAFKKVIEKRIFIAQLTPKESDVFIIAVPTPHDYNLSANLNHVKSAVKSILPVLEQGNIIIIESTIPPRTTRDIVAPILENDGFIPGQDVYLAHCPERVLPGNILSELVENNRIVGGINEISAKKAAEVYRTFVTGKVIETSAESAEMSKLMENTYRDVNIALANELAKISNQLNINTLEVIELANEHPRVNIHQPGPGVGGHCIAVDPYFIIESEPYKTELIKTARSINESMPDFIVNQVNNILKNGSKIAVFGLAYKGNIDDIRNSPSLEIIEKLKNQNYNTYVYDPFVKQDQVDFQLSTFDESIENSDLILILTDHKKFKNIDWTVVSQMMSTPNVFDTKNCIKDVNGNINFYNFDNMYELKKKSLV